MQFFLARLKEADTKHAIGSLCLLIVLAAGVFGVDVDALLSHAEATTGRVVALLALIGGVGVQLNRILTPTPPAAVAEKVVSDIAEKTAEKVVDQIGGQS